MHRMNKDKKKQLSSHSTRSHVNEDKQDLHQSILLKKKKKLNKIKKHNVKIEFRSFSVVKIHRFFIFIFIFIFSS